MFTALGAFLNNILTSAQTSLVPAIIGISLLIGGATWALGNHDRGKSAVVAGLIGGAIMLLAVTLATALRSSLGATG